MWKTVARFVSEPVYHEVRFMKFYKATLENKNGNFVCSFGEKYLQGYSREKRVCFLKCKETNFGFSCQEIEFLDNNEEITSWVETAGKESKEKAIQNKDNILKELAEKAKIIINLLEKETGNNWIFRIDSQPFSLYLESSKSHLRFLISNFAKNQVILDNNPALNHLKNVYVDLTKIDIYYLFKDIQERVRVLEKCHTETRENSHFCPLPSEYEEAGKRYRENCIGKVKGEVLSTEVVPDKHDNSGEECWKIRINEWKNLWLSKECVVWYGSENYSKRPFPEVGKTYWFFLHERQGINHKYNQHGWQWAHDWQLWEPNN